MIFLDLGKSTFTPQCTVKTELSLFYSTVLLPNHFRTPWLKFTFPLIEVCNKSEEIL